MIRTLRKRKQYVVLSVLLCLVTVFGVFQYKRANELEYARQIEYNRVFSELTEYVDDLEISLLKGQIVNSPQQMAQLSSELYRQASGAKANLALLPVREDSLEKTYEFLSQVGEYATAVSAKMLRGEKMSEDEIKTIKNLSGYATQLKKGLDGILIGINNGAVSFTEEQGTLLRVMNSKNSVISTDLAALEEEFHSYPSLIYDGPFSQHLNLKEAVFVKGKPQVTEKQVKSAAAKFIGDKNCTVHEVGGALPSYTVNCEETTVEYTKNGKVLLLLMKNRQPDEAKLSIDDARKKAELFLRDNGFKDMRESYYENREGSIVINYAYEQDDYTVFSDLVKVKVALDNGEIIGFESRGYIMNHVYRDIPTPIISKEDALKNINENLTVKDVSMAVIPLENGSEACCYQIKGIVSDKHFLVYVNTQTGFVEDMQILIETAGGTLAV